MTKEFIELSIFQKQWAECELDEEDLRELEEYLCENPDKGDIIQGTAGIRKIRWTAKNKGKRGGSRVIYIHFISCDLIYLMAAYSKNQKIDLSPKEKK